MKPFAVPLVLALALAGCAGEEEQLENSIRENLASQGEVQSVDLSAADGGRYTGTAMVRLENGSERRFNCQADPKEGESGSFDWRCLPAIDEAALTEMEQTIRLELSDRAIVQEVDMQRADDDNMRGHALLADGQGNQLRVDCTAERQDETPNFAWQCAAPSQ